jgi:hypothetical protein
LYPVKLHFNGKENSEELYKTLCEKMEQHIGIVNIESLECCIHFVSTYTFAAVRVLKEKLLIDFSLNNPLQSKRFFKIANLSRQRFLYHMEIKKKEEVDSELLAWLKMASDKEFEKATLD